MFPVLGNNSLDKSKRATKIVQINSTPYRFFVTIIKKKPTYLHSPLPLIPIYLSTPKAKCLSIHPRADTIRAKRNEWIPLGFVHVQGLHTEKMSITLALVGRVINHPSPRSSTNYPLPATLHVYKFAVGGNSPPAIER